MGILALFVISSIVLVQADETSWDTFKATQHKIYKNPIEQFQREKIFNDNLAKIEEHNKKYEQGQTSYKEGINEFSDLTAEEFGARFNTLQVDENRLQNGQEHVDLTNNGAKVLLDSIDWRTKSVVTEVKNQGACGSCWAFSTVGTIESQLAIQTGELKALSEQQLVDCNLRNLGCMGGNIRVAIDYVTANGLTLEKNYPYTGVQMTCNRSNDIVVQTRGYATIQVNNETQLKEAVGLVGPVAVAINGAPIQSYQEGIFDGECSNTLTHGVLAVGYGKNDTTGVEYWIVKNSWGKAWGEEGYFRLKMGSNLCGIASQGTYAVLNPRPNSAYFIKVIFVEEGPLTEEELLHYLENDDLSEASFLSDDNDLGWDSTEQIDNDFNHSIQEELDIEDTLYMDNGDEENDEINERQENEQELIENEEGWNGRMQK